MRPLSEVSKRSTFGDYFNPEPLRRADGKMPVSIIVATRVPGGLRPKVLLLPHQLYVETAQRLLEGDEQRELWVHPIYEGGFSDNWSEVVFEGGKDNAE